MSTAPTKSYLSSYNMADDRLSPLVDDTKQTGSYVSPQPVDPEPRMEAFSVEHIPTDRKDTVSFCNMLYLLLWKNQKFVGKKLILKILMPWAIVAIIGAASMGSGTLQVNCYDETSDDCPDVYYQKSQIAPTNWSANIGYYLGDKLCGGDRAYPWPGIRYQVAFSYFKRWCILIIRDIVTAGRLDTI